MQVTVAFHSNVRSNPNYFVCLLSELIVRPKIGNREKHILNETGETIVET